MITVLISSWVGGSILLTLALAAAASRRTPGPVQAVANDHRLDLGFQIPAESGEVAPEVAPTH